MEVYQQSGWWIVRVNGERFKFSTEKEQLEFVAGLESNDGYEEKESYKEKDTSKKKNSSPTIGVSKKDSKGKSKKK